MSLYLDKRWNIALDWFLEPAAGYLKQIFVSFEGGFEKSAFQCIYNVFVILLFFAFGICYNVHKTLIATVGEYSNFLTFTVFYAKIRHSSSNKTKSVYLPSGDFGI